MKPKTKPVSITVKSFSQGHMLPEAAVFKRGILAILAEEKRKVNGQITVCFVDQQIIRDLNRRYLDIDETTDVLSFNYGANAWAADIVICVEEAARNAREYKTTLASELFLYTAHGLLHLLGYDDQSPRKEKVMREKERAYAKYFEAPKG